MPIYLTLQLIRCAACFVAKTPGELLPRLFTLTAQRADGGCFLSHYSTLANGFPLGNMMLCVARTFLTQHIELRATRHATAIIIPIYLQRYAHFHNFQPRSAFFYTPSSPASALSSYFLQFCHVFIFNLFLHIASTPLPNLKHLLNPQFFLLIYIKITH